MRKILLAVLLAGLVLGFVSAPARAQTGAESDIPELNPLCWQKEDCMKARKQINTNIIDDVMDDAAAEAGWLSGVSAGKCDKNGPDGKPLWGKCLPVGKTVTSISFGGKKEFENIGEFIITIYNYGVGLAGIVAVLVIILSGAQWVASGGNSEMIGAAKKRIGGAVIGLMILFSSFVILNTINPNLVKFRLPRIWLIRNSKMMPEFCRQSPSSTDFALLGVNGQTVNLDKFNSIALAPTNFDAMQCGDQYAIKGGGTSICHGDVCNVGSSHQVCAPYIYANMTYGKGYSCVDGQILIRFDMAALMDAINQSRVGADKTEGDKWLDYTDVEVYGVCKNPTTKGLAIGKKSHTWGKGEANVNAQLIDKSSSPWSYAIVYGGFT